MRSKFKVHMSVFIPMAVVASAVGLILFLVTAIIGFSNKVTDYYTPNILAFEDFAEAGLHLRHELERHAHVGPDNVAFLHFASSLSKTRAALTVEDPRAAEHFPLLVTAENIRQAVETGDRVPTPAEVQSILEELGQHAREHKLELVKAKNRIKHYTVVTAGLCLVVLLFGLWFSLREYKLAEERRRRAETVSALKSLVRALDARDPYTRGHSDRVSRYALLLAGELRLDKKAREFLELAGIMHDIGKIGVPDAILHKTTRLSADEYEIMKRHPRISAEMLEGVENLQAIIPGILHHHERWDGGGYPAGLQGEAIPLEARILAVADAYDAMTSSRPYRQAMTAEATDKEIRRSAGKQWSQEMAEAFLRVLHQEREARRPG